MRDSEEKKRSQVAMWLPRRPVRLEIGSFLKCLMHFLNKPTKLIFINPSTGRLNSGAVRWYCLTAEVLVLELCLLVMWGANGTPIWHTGALGLIAFILTHPRESSSERHVVLKAYCNHQRTPFNKNKNINDASDTLVASVWVVWECSPVCVWERDTMHGDSVLSHLCICEQQMGSLG